MNEKQITFQVDERKFTTKLVSNTKSQNKIHYYIISKSKDIIDLTLTKDDITEVLKGDNESCPIMIKSEESNTSSDEKTELISSKLKGKFLDKVIASYKNKYR